MKLLLSLTPYTTHAVLILSAVPGGRNSGLSYSSFFATSACPISYSYYYLQFGRFYFSSFQSSKGPPDSGAYPIWYPAHFAMECQWDQQYEGGTQGVPGEARDPCVCVTGVLSPIHTRRQMPPKVRLHL